MARYFFDVQIGEIRAPDKEGQDLDGIEAAHKEATTILGSPCLGQFYRLPSSATESELAPRHSRSRPAGHRPGRRYRAGRQAPWPSFPIPVRELDAGRPLRPPTA